MKFQQGTALSGTALSYVARLALVGLVLAPVSLVAQQTDPAAAPSATQEGGYGHGHGDPAERQAHMLKMMTKKLSLTPDQVTQVKSIQADNETQAQSIHSDTSLQPADKRAKMMDLHKSENDKVRALLTDDQKTKFDAMQAQRQDHMRGPHNGDQNAPSAPPAQ